MLTNLIIKVTKAIYIFIYYLLIPIKYWKSKNSNIRKVFFVHPKYIVNNWGLYKKTKQNKKQNPYAKRPVMIADEDKDNHVVLSAMTTATPTKKQLDNLYRVELKKTAKDNSFKKRSYVNTQQIKRNALTKKPFEVGKKPLTKEEKYKIAHSDFVKYKYARKKRK